MSVVENVAGFRFFAVYDGHAGSEAVLAAKKVLPEKMASCQYAGTDVKMAICSAFKAADEKSLSSCCKVLALVKGKDLWIANLGDCRAVACKENKAETITFDHSPVKNEAEVKRLQQLGVTVCGVNVSVWAVSIPQRAQRSMGSSAILRCSTVSWREISTFCSWRLTASSML